MVFFLMVHFSSNNAKKRNISTEAFRFTHFKQVAAVRFRGLPLIKLVAHDPSWWGLSEQAPKYEKPKARL